MRPEEQVVREAQLELRGATPAEAFLGLEPARFPILDSAA
jgi:hypothetical protein